MFCGSMFEIRIHQHFGSDLGTLGNGHVFFSFCRADSFFRVNQLFLEPKEFDLTQLC